MMWSKYKSIIIADIKTISANYRLLFAFVILLILIIFQTFYFPVLSDFVFRMHGFRLDEYHSLISITLVALIPVLIGIEYGSLVCIDVMPEINLLTKKTPETEVNTLFIRGGIAVLLSLCFIVISILLIKPVPEQGWLRTIYATVLFSLQTPLLILFRGKSSGKKKGSSLYTWLSWYAILALPLGLLLHHPWNYLAFLSPFYWVAWGWLIQSPSESLIYGIIAMLITLATSTALIRYFIRQRTG